MADANYKPVVVGDTANMSDEEFMQSRTGIGGSDQATLLGLSPYSCLYELWLKCTGETMPVQKDSFEKKRGHILEELVAEMFRNQTGYIVLDDTSIYVHPQYPYLRANLDRIYQRPQFDPDGNVLGTIEGILECKTVDPKHPDVKDYWKKNQVPPRYLLQVMYYMMIKNVDEAYVACMYGISQSDYVQIKVLRNKDLEAQLLKRNVGFWTNYVVPKICPPKEITLKAENAIRAIRQNQKVLDGQAALLLDPSYLSRFDEVTEIDKELQSLKKKEEELKEKKLKLLIPVYDLMGSHTEGILDCEDGCNYYAISYKMPEKTTISAEILYEKYPKLAPTYTKVCVSNLKKDFPQIAEELSTVEVNTESRPLSIKKKKLDEKSRMAIGMRKFLEETV